MVQNPELLLRFTGFSLYQQSGQWSQKMSRQFMCLLYMCTCFLEKIRILLRYACCPIQHKNTWYNGLFYKITVKKYLLWFACGVMTMKGKQFGLPIKQKIDGWKRLQKEDDWNLVAINCGVWLYVSYTYTGCPIPPGRLL